ncbi:MAG: CHASE2 domain-containing protein [Gloeomargaritaceae cyanobacterium C42_A2020_066]|nr:CHASE2 domain-containing protein [Gloeomargaritaceae cyanobacterium C42_A2020_066]
MKTVVAPRKPPPPRKRTRSLALLVGLAVAGSVALLRQTGMLQSAELYAYDALIRVQPDWGADPRLVFVAVDDRTVARLNSDTLSDAALLATLERLRAYAPRVIAVDIFRDVPIGPGRDALLDYLNQQFLPLEGRIKPIILTCQLPSLGNPRGIDPPPVLDPADGIGYADVELDADKVVRRVAFSGVPATETPFFGFALTPGPEVRCRAPFALGFLSALSYLQTEGITLSRSAGGNFNVGGVRFAPLPRTMGGYNNLDPGLYQTLLAYRGRRPAVVVSLADVLEGTADADVFRDRVVLLGYSTLDKGDFHETLWTTTGYLAPRPPCESGFGGSPRRPAADLGVAPLDRNPMDRRVGFSGSLGGTQD